MIFTSCQLAQETTYLLEMYIHFPVIWLVTFVQEAFKPHFKNQVAGRIPHRLSQEGSVEKEWLAKHLAQTLDTSELTCCC